MAEAAAASRIHLRQEAELAAARLPPLMVAAERVAATVQQGVHGRRRVGMGEAFWQFRRYEPGDPVRRIDWRQSGKTDKLFPAHWDPKLRIPRGQVVAAASIVSPKY